MGGRLGAVARVLVVVGIVAAGVVGTASADEHVDDPALVDEGREIFEANCAGCHGADGTGGQGRSLIDIAVEQPDRSVHIMSVTEGKGFMPAWGEELTPEEIHAVVSYVRLEFGGAMAPEPVADELAATGTSTDLGLVIGATSVAAGLALVAVARRRALVG